MLRKENLKRYKTSSIARVLQKGERTKADAVSGASHNRPFAVPSQVLVRPEQLDRGLQHAKTNVRQER